MTRTVTRTSLVSLGAAAVLTASLAGCGASAGSAAVVGGRRIAVSDVQSATVDVQQYVGQDMRIYPTRMLNFLAIGPYIDDLAEKHGVGISDEEARVELAAKVPHPSQAGVDVIRTNGELAGLQQRLGPEQASKDLSEVAQRLKADGLEVNPRFDGSPDQNTGQMMFERPSWLAPTPVQQPVLAP